MHLAHWVSLYRAYLGSILSSFSVSLFHRVLLNKPLNATSHSRFNWELLFAHDFALDKFLCRLLFIAVSLCDCMSRSNQRCFFVDIALEKFSKFLKANLGITIGVNATYHSKYFLLNQVVAEASEEVL